jgi:hypothetical protein
VNNGLKDSPLVSVHITILPNNTPPGPCQRINPPRYRGSVVQRNTHSHGGGYSPAFSEYWYPGWSGPTIYRYSRNHQFLGTFRSGRNQIMQLSGDTDGTYYTAHWGLKKVSRWQGLSSNLIWAIDLNATIGGVTSDDQYVYAMDYRAPTVWKLDKATGRLEETFTVPSMAGTLYGGLQLIDGIFYVGRHHGVVYRIDLATRQILDSSTLDSYIYNMSFDGNDYCVSANNTSIFCYEVCDATQRPRANPQQLSTHVNTAFDITLTGTDPNNLPLTFEVITPAEHGSITGTPPNLRYDPIRDFTGFDSFTFRVSNGGQDSTATSVSIAILPDLAPPGPCQRVHPPRYRGGLVEMNTRSHGGGYSPAFNEYWYPQWAGTTVYRYNADHQYLGYFRTGRDHIMQLHGLRDGSYVTAHWDRRKVSRWQALGNSLIWAVDVPGVVGGVTSDENFVYAMDYRASTVWKINLATGVLLETIALPSQAGTLYGGLEMIDGILYSGRHHGVVYRINLQQRTITDEFSVDANIYNWSFNGNDICVSPNSNTVYCYTVCDDNQRPSALSQQVTTRVNNSVNITLTATDPGNRPLTYTVVALPQHGSLTGTAPNLNYAPITEYVGFDSLTFKVNNGIRDSATVQVNITILPPQQQQGQCNPVHPPRYRGSQTHQNTHSHGGGYSPAFREYWYPGWGGPTIYRYNRDHEFLGTFRSGRDQIMQLHGLDDGSYLTAHWSRKRVSRWQALGANLVWAVTLPDVVGGVTADATHVWAMAHQQPTLWKINKATGVLEATYTLESMEGTLYGGLAIVGTTLYSGRHHGLVYRYNLTTRDRIDTFRVDTRIYNSSFDGNDYCVSPNSQRMFCYTMCEDPVAPTAHGQLVSTRVNATTSITLTGTDPNNRNLTYTVTSQPLHGSLTGTAPNLTYEPITDFTGADGFTFRVNNGVSDSVSSRVNITILPQGQQLQSCALQHPPPFIGGLVSMNSRSHGGGYSPAFSEYWYPGWAGTTVYRYDKNHRFLGTFRSGSDYMMQLWGLDDGTYLTAHWSRNRVSRWQGLSDNLLWAVDLGANIGGVASDGNFAYAIAHTGQNAWKLNLENGAVIEQLTLPSMGGTVYGGLAIIDGILYVGRHDGWVYRINLQTRALIDRFSLDSNIYNMSFNGRDYCISPNNSSLYCYTVCGDNNRPTANGAQATTRRNTAVDITLTGSDPQNRALTFAVVERPAHGSLSGTPPNVHYEPILNYIGVDSFTFKVNNGVQDSSAVAVGIAVLPPAENQGNCNRLHPPRYRGSPVTMNTRSHGGGWSAAFGEYWYPQWSGTEIFRYDRDNQFIGTFRTGRDQVMQLQGLADGSYVTAHWNRRKVAKWHALSANLIWSVDLPTTVGGVAVEGNFAYAMAHSAPTLWKINLTTGALVSTHTLTNMGNTLYGGLIIIDGILYVGRHNAQVWRFRMSDFSLIDSDFRTASNIYNMSFDGNDICVSPNNSSMYCYTICDDNTRPRATSQDVATDKDVALDITLSGTDPNNRNLTYAVISQPANGQITGTAPNVRYTPSQGFVGLDHFSFKVNNGIKDSAPVRINITVRPGNNHQFSCTLRNEPIFRGAPVTMNTRSYGGGFSPLYSEYMYPQWSGSTVYRFNTDHQQVGYFSSGRSQLMQLTGLDDGSYVAAHWGHNNVSRWRGDSVLWTTSIGVTASAVAAEGDFVYAMYHGGTQVWKLRKDNGSLVETFNLSGSMGGTLYGGLVIINGTMFIGRTNGVVYKASLQARQISEAFRTATTIRNMSFNGSEICISANTDQLYCYRMCDDPDLPVAVSQHVTTRKNVAVDITVAGTDSQNRTITFTNITQPQHGSLSGTAPNFRYTPISEYVGADAFTFRVFNGVKNSVPGSITINVLPPERQVGQCTRVDPPELTGGQISQNTRSYGGGYNPGYDEYWYPQWSGTTIHRYDRSRSYIGSFTIGLSQTMQLWGEEDGSFYTANWGLQSVSKWRGVSGTSIWTRNLGETVGGVAADANFVYAMASGGSTVWKINKANGNLEETFSLPRSLAGTNYGGMNIVNGQLWTGRHHGLVYRFSLETRQEVDQLTLASGIRSVTFDGQDYCISNNNNVLYCYRACRDETRPTASSQQVATRLNTPKDIVLTGTDPRGRNLTYTVLENPQHGSLSGTAPNLRYSPINTFVGSDSLSFRVNNGLNDSSPAQLNITVLPNVDPPGQCSRIDPPEYRGSPVTMTTHSYGGGYSPAFAEYWYPAWSGTTIYRYNKDRQQIGYFRASRGSIMQLWGLDDGTYLTANWGLKSVGRWQALSGNLVWNTDLNATIGGVTSDGTYVYAMDYRAPTLWKLNKNTGILLETITLPSMSGTLYGGLALIDGLLHVGRDSGRVHVMNITTRTEVKAYAVATSVRNSSFDGREYCVTSNSDSNYCYAVCSDPDQPLATGARVTTRVNTAVDITLAGTDPQGRNLTYTLVERAVRGSLSGTAPNLRYTPIVDYTGFDSLTFKVNNGIKDSPVARVNISVLPNISQPGPCNRVDPPRFRGGAVTMETYSYGGGYSPAFDEYWYPQWSGTRVHRFNRDRQYLGSFLIGQRQIMQLWGDPDGTMYTAHWGLQTVAKWQGLSSEALWVTNLGVTVGGVTADANFVYAMGYSGKTVWKLNKDTGAIVEQFDLNFSPGWGLYGGLAIVDGELLQARTNGNVYRANLQTRDLIGQFSTATTTRNLAWDGHELCASNNTSSLYCYAICDDTSRPTALGQQVSTQVNTGVNITLAGTDPNNLALTYTVVTRPQHGSLAGTAPNVTYAPIRGRTGTDRFTFKVNNGNKDSATTSVDIAILPPARQNQCNPLQTPRYRGAQVNFNTRSHGGGYSPAFHEYWYPQWSGTTIYRYDRDLKPLGTFRAGQAHIMQLWGEPDGTYLTAHWDYKGISRWQALSDNLLWTAAVPDTVGGVTSDENFIYAMHYRDPTVWKLSKSDGRLLETITLQGTIEGTLYGGLAMFDGKLVIGRHHGVVYRYDIGTRMLIDRFTVASYIYNMSFDGRDFCVSPNNSSLACYSFCEDPAQPLATGLQVLTEKNRSVNFTLQGTDPNNRNLTFSLVTPPEHGSLVGTPPILEYIPIRDRVGVDRLTFKVNNGTQDSDPATVSFTIVPEQRQQFNCQLSDTPQYRGRSVSLNTRSHGGGYSPAFNEYWYPNWSGRTITRYSANREFIGIFYTGYPNVMQLWGDADGSYYTANWGRRVVAKWHGLTDNLIWSRDVPATVGGVTTDANFVYAMASSGQQAWKLDKATGAIVQSLTVPSMPGTLYGGLAALDGDLLVGRSNRNVYRVDLDTNLITSTFTVAQAVYSMSFNGVDYCISNNSTLIYCYSVCSNAPNRRPFLEEVRNQSNSEADTVTLTLVGTDADNNPLTYTGQNLPPGIAVDRLTGEVSGTVSNGAQANSPYSTIITISDGLANFSVAFTWTIFDPALAPLVFVSRTPGNGWTNAAFRVNARVTDTTCTMQPVVFVQGRNLTTTTQSSQNGWNITSALVSGTGVQNFSLRARSACSDKTAISNVLVGIDTTIPTINFTAGQNELSQNGVDNADINTYPKVDGFVELSMIALLRDDAAGMASATATVTPIIVQNNAPVLDTDNRVAIASETFPVVSNSPPTGPRTARGTYCTVNTYCTGGKFKLSSISGTQFELELRALDKAGNVATAKYRYAVIDLAASIRAWRDKIRTITTENVQARTRLTSSAAKLDLTLLALAEGETGNIFLSLEDAGALITQARAFDGNIDVKAESLLVGNVATGWFERLLDQTKGQLGQHNHFDRAAQHVVRAKQNLQLKDHTSAQSAFLELANGFFWLETVRFPLTATDFRSSLTVMERILGRMDGYVANVPVLPGRTEVSQARTDLTTVHSYLSRILVHGADSEPDQAHVDALLTLADAAESIKAAEETTAWVRQYQWGLTQIVYILANRGLANSASVLGLNNPVILRGQAQLTIADTYRQAYRADDFMSLLINSRCIIIGLYNLAYNPDVTVPTSCCALIREYNGLDSRVPVPQHCQL